MSIQTCHCTALWSWSYLISTDTHTADKLANYEDEVRRLKTQAQHTATIAPGSEDVPTALPLYAPAQSRIANFMHSRKLTPPSAQGPTARETELQAALAREQDLRRIAEAKVSEMNNEIEDLSATLFEQANEMVATERREKAKLQSRVQELEQRDEERARRLEKLEAAMRRIERVKTLLAP